MIPLEKLNIELDLYFNSRLKELELDPRGRTYALMKAQEDTEKYTARITS